MVGQEGRGDARLVVVSARARPDRSPGSKTPRVKQGRRAGRRLPTSPGARRPRSGQSRGRKLHLADQDPQSWPAREPPMHRQIERTEPQRRIERVPAGPTPLADIAEAASNVCHSCPSGGCCLSCDHVASPPCVECHREARGPPGESISLCIDPLRVAALTHPGHPCGLVISHGNTCTYVRRGPPVTGRGRAPVALARSRRWCPIVGAAFPGGTFKPTNVSGPRGITAGIRATVIPEYGPYRPRLIECRNPSGGGRS